MIILQKTAENVKRGGNVFCGKLRKDGKTRKPFWHISAILHPFPQKRRRPLLIIGNQ